MLAYIIRRLIQSLFVIVAVVILVFVLARLSGDPAILYLPLDATPDQHEAYRRNNGLDQPTLVQLRIFLQDVTRLEFGTSLWQKRPAMPIVLERLPFTLTLASFTTLIAFTIALVLGTLAAVKPMSIFDRIVSSLSIIGGAVPSFWLGLVLIMVFAVKLRLVPTSGTGGFLHLILPVTTLTWPMTGSMALVVRSSVLQFLDAPFTVTARAKGLFEHTVIFGHVGRNALIPVITLAGTAFIGVANGAVIVETVFGWPGIGKLMIDAIQRRDFPIIQAVVFVVAVVVVALNLLLDLIYAAVDPRIRYE